MILFEEGVYFGIGNLKHIGGFDFAQIYVLHGARHDVVDFGDVIRDGKIEGAARSLGLIDEWGNVHTTGLRLRSRGRRRCRNGWEDHARFAHDVLTGGAGKKFAPLPSGVLVLAVYSD